MRVSNDWFHFDLSEEDVAYINSLDIPFDKVVFIGDMNNLLIIRTNIYNMPYYD